jgi:hypothetical protein
MFVVLVFPPLASTPSVVVVGAVLEVLLNQVLLPVLNEVGSPT